MKQLPSSKSPFDPNQKKHVSDPAQSPAFQHRCPCKKNGAPGKHQCVSLQTSTDGVLECDCPHKGGCNLASTCATASRSRSPSTITTTMATSPAHALAPSKHLSTRNTVKSPALSLSAYSFGYDGSMSLSKVGALLMSIESGQLDPVNILDYLPQNLSRAFGGRVTRRNKRPKAVRV